MKSDPKRASDSCSRSPIPDLRFATDQLIAEPPHITARLCFDCTPVGEVFGFSVNGQRVSFTENVFYEFSAGRIRNVHSVIDKAAVEAQLNRALPNRHSLGNTARITGSNVARLADRSTWLASSVVGRTRFAARPLD